MKLFIAGGVGEHGRNCFYVQGEKICFLVDCGKMADTPENPYPRLAPEQIRRLEIVFLTHSHADHTGALPWLYENGFRGVVAATEETLRQLPFAVERSCVLEEVCSGGGCSGEVCPDGVCSEKGVFGSFEVRWGRSGHCAGSVWYHFLEKSEKPENERAIFFSGDYTEDTLVYACHPIRGQCADLAVLDCAYGMDETTYAAACARLLRTTEELLIAHKLLFFPVPKYGRGLEILKLLSDGLGRESNHGAVKFYGDSLFLQNLAGQQAGGFWYRTGKISVPVQLYSGQKQGILFVSDPQLRSEAARHTAEQVLGLGGRAVMTGTLEKGSYSEALSEQGKMELLRYPVHLNYSQFEQLKEKNSFARTIPYHTPDFSAKQEILF